MYQLGKHLTSPFFLLCFLLGALLINLWYRRRETKGRLLALTALYLALVALGLPVVGRLALLSLECQYPSLHHMPAEAQAIVVLEGGECGSLYRCLRAAELYRGGMACPVLLSCTPDTARYSSAVAMREHLLRLGVRAEDILLEKGSQNTYENAVNSREILDVRGVHTIVLVTDAVHMPRAAACFRKQGYEVVAAGHPLDPEPGQNGLFEYLPDVRALYKSGYASQEWLGLAWYWCRGRI
jgi:uncharacterized SAM-binding protein YcdF (DUF218 family)